ncbi:MAG: DUF1622 domain-containing protein [Proteobacteria bacterium]|nr:DUF1622 domain-containing protein [Pseudomonadota bacterium]
MIEGYLSHQIIATIAQLLGYAGVGFIAIGTIIAFIRYFRMPAVAAETRTVIQLTLKTHLLVGLELMICQDILRAIIDPGVGQLVSVGVIAALRVVLGHYLKKAVAPALGAEATGIQSPDQMMGATGDLGITNEFMASETSEQTFVADQTITRPHGSGPDFSQFDETENGLELPLPAPHASQPAIPLNELQPARPASNAGSNLAEKVNHTKVLPQRNFVRQASDEPSMSGETDPA